jgi:hypothetical protein
MQNKKEKDRIFFENVVFISLTLYFVGIIAVGLWDIITDLL